MYSTLDYFSYPLLPDSKQASFGDINGMASHDSQMFWLFVLSRKGLTFREMRLPAGFDRQTATLTLCMENMCYVIRFQEPVQYSGRGQMLRLLTEERELRFDTPAALADFLCQLAIEEEESDCEEEVEEEPSDEENVLALSDIYYRIPYPERTFDFHFHLVDRDPNGDHDWCAEIADPIDYQGRSTGLCVTHRLHSDNDGYIVCWQGTIHSKEELLAVLQLWCHCTAIYIREGRTIDETRVEVAEALGLM